MSSMNPRLKDLKAGQHLEAHAGFPCLAEGRVEKVRSHRDGSLYIRCAAGMHFLDGQTDHTGRLVGLSLCADPKGGEA